MYFLNQRVHLTWFVTVGCIGLVAGVALAQYTGPVSGLFCIAGGLCVLMSILRRRVWMFALIASGSLMIGLWRGGLELQALGVYEYFFGRVVSVTGEISTDPQPVSGGKQGISLGNLQIQGRRLGGRLHVSIDADAQLRRGDRLTVQGKVSTGYGTYAASIYNATIEKNERPNNIFLDIRDAFSGAFKMTVAEPMASLGVGFLVGQKSELPSDFSEALKIAGLTHIVVASGYNLTILVRLARRVFEKISKYQAALWSVLMILGFMAITGWSASMSRAGLVAGLSLLAWYYGRAFHPVTLLAFAASVTVMIYPAYAWGDIGWALSFSAFAGVIILAPLLQAFFYDKEKTSFIARTLLETTSAQILTLPIMLGVFGQFSLVALFSNLLVLPLVPLAMAGVFIAGLSQIVIPVVAPIVAWPVDFLLRYMVWVVNWTAELPWAQIKWQMPWWGIVLSYAVIAALCFYLKRLTQYDLRKVNIVE